jgi:acyl carrier protein
MIEIDEIRNRVMQLLERISGIPRDDMDADSTFDDIDLDSLSRIELLVELEREFDIELPEDEKNEDLMKQIQSVEEAARLVETNLTAKETA